jgi:hypothetical protein
MTAILNKKRRETVLTLTLSDCSRKRGIDGENTAVSQYNDMLIPLRRTARSTDERGSSGGAKERSKQN